MVTVTRPDPREPWFRRTSARRFEAANWKGRTVAIACLGTFLLSFSAAAVAGKGHPHVMAVCLALMFGSAVVLLAALTLRLER
jgi:hypothetical protein